MRRIDRWPLARHSAPPLRSITLLAVTIAMSVPTAAHASHEADELCLNSQIRNAAVEAVTNWSQNYPFAKVIIGDQGRDGEVLEPHVAIENSSFVVCRTTYQLVHIGSNANGYVVRINDLFFRITPAGSQYQVSLEDMPESLGATGMTSRELLSRFTIDGRPYLDVLDANQRRLAHQRQGTAP